MEGCRRGAVWVAAALAGCALIAGASGCGGDTESSASAAPAGVQTESPERTFAPLVELAADEPWRPMSARWFIERSVLWFAEDDGCPDRKIAVGHTLPEQQNPTIDWIYPKGLGDGSSSTYYRNPWDAKCDYDFDKRFYADHLTRPFDPGVRVEGIRPGEGYYLDLVDAARPGPPIRSDATRTVGEPAVPVYAERIDEGDSGIRLVYWMLFGMHGRPGEPGAHEGDWQRIDVLLRDLGGDRYEPLSVQLRADGDAGAPSSDVVWADTRRVDGAHVVVLLSSATHVPTAAGAGERCEDCLRWETWRSLAEARKEVWYGFGGAWGEVGSSSADTGPLGPHRFFSTEPSRS